MKTSNLRFAIGVVLSLFLVACGENGTETVDGSERSAPGRLVIIGGGLQAENTAVYQAVLDGRDGEGPLCVFPTASADPQESIESAVGRFDAVGGAGTAEGIWITVDNPEAASDPATVEQIGACSGFYFVGGQQGRIVEVFRPEEGDTPAYTALMERHAAGSVVSGSSAGAAIMNDPMIGGGQSAGALAVGVRSEENPVGVLLEKGMGFFAGGMVDQHFLARGRWARLLVAVFAQDAHQFGFGIDENTALVVEGDSVWVVGASSVVFFDTRDAVRDQDGNAGSGIVLNLLGSGDGVSLSTGEVSVPVEKADVPVDTGPATDSPLDIFDRWALLKFLSESAVSAESAYFFSQSGHSFEFLKGPGFRARSLEGLGVQDTPLGLSVGPFLLSVQSDPSN